MFVIPTTVHAVTRSAIRQREYAEKHGLIRESGWPAPKTLTPAAERKEIRNCIIAIAVFALLIAATFILPEVLA